MSLLQDISQAVSEIQGAIVTDDGASVAIAYTYPQWNVPPAALPFFVNLFRGGPTDFSAIGGLQHIEGTMEMWLGLQPKTAGSSLAANQEYVLSWPPAVWTAFAAHVQLGNPDLVRESYIKKWDNVIFQYGVQEYYGLRFDLWISAQLITPIGV